MFNRNRNVKENKRAVSLITMIDKTSPVSEQYRSIRTNIQFSMVNNELQTLVITSSGPGEGKSTTSANLAVVFANSGFNVLLVDADLRKPTVDKTFVLPNYSGLSTLLGNRATIEQSIQLSTITNLDILTSGPKPANPSEILNSNRMTGIIAEMKEKYDLIIFDMPPVVTVTDAQIMAAKADGTILVVRENVTDKALLKKAKNSLEIVKADFLGVVYNGSSRNKDKGYYYYGGEK